MALTVSASTEGPRIDVALSHYRDKWKQNQVATQPANRDAAEEGVKCVYRMLGLPVPRIEWAASPIEMERSRRRNWHVWSPGHAVKFELVERIMGRLRNDIAMRLGFQSLRQFSRAMTLPPSMATAGASVDAAVNPAVRATTGGLSGGLAGLWAAVRGTYLGMQSFEVSRWAQHEYRESLALIDFLHAQRLVPGLDDLANGLCAVADNAGWLLPHRDVCWLSERPSILELDPLGRLHASGGPALAFRDGWSFYAWKGIAVPGWIIRYPDRITPRTIGRNRPLLRRVMIEIITPEAFIRQGDVLKVGVDATGVLWRARWNDADSWAAVEVLNGTPEPDGTCKKYFLQVPPDLQTPTEAVAWTYGLDERTYAGLARRT